MICKKLTATQNWKYPEWLALARTYIYSMTFNLRATCNQKIWSYWFELLNRHPLPETCSICPLFLSLFVHLLHQKSWPGPNCCWAGTDSKKSNTSSNLIPRHLPHPLLGFTGIQATFSLQRPRQYHPTRCQEALGAPTLGWRPSQKIAQFWILIESSSWGDSFA